GEVGVVLARHDEALVRWRALRIGVRGEPGPAEQQRVLGAERARRGGRRRAAVLGGQRAGELPEVAVEAVQAADELQRRHAAEIAADAVAVGRRLAEQDRVAAMAAGLQTGITGV